MHPSVLSHADTSSAGIDPLNTEDGAELLVVAVDPDALAAAGLTRSVTSSRSLARALRGLAVPPLHRCDRLSRRWTL